MPGSAAAAAGAAALPSVGALPGGSALSGRSAALAALPLPAVAAAAAAAGHGIKGLALRLHPLLPIGVAGEVWRLVFLPRPLAQLLQAEAIPAAAAATATGCHCCIGRRARPCVCRPPVHA